MLGLMATPTGLLQSAETTPITIDTGVIVLSDGRNNTAAVGIRGLVDMVEAFEFHNGRWRLL